MFDWTILKYQQAQKNRVQPRISVSSILLMWAFLCISFSFLGKKEEGEGKGGVRFVTGNHNLNVPIVLRVLKFDVSQPIPGASNSRAMALDVENHQG